MNKSSANDRPADDSDAPRRAGQAANPKSGGVTPPERGATTPSQAEQQVPRLPHERDESADSETAPGEESPSEEITLQAYEDLERGLVDTDEGLEGHVVEKCSSRRRPDKHGKT